MIRKILIGLAIVVGAFLLLVAVQPSEFVVSRSRILPVPAAVVFDQINDLHKWQAWSPWAKLDPLCKITFAGPVAGKDASFSWDGNDQVGSGRMRITESRPNVYVRFDLEFKKPFEATNVAEFSLQEMDKQHTSVTWRMSGKNNFLFKAVGLFMNCDKMLGPEFEKGLENLKNVAEAANKTQPPINP